MDTTLAPPELTGPARPVYIALRLLHLAAVSAALPLAIAYWKMYPGGTASQPWAGPLLIPGAVFWALFFIVLEQYSYPAGLRGALLATGSIVINAWLALRISGDRALFGAYQVFMSALAAQALFIAAASVWFVREKLRQRASLAEITWRFLWLLGLIVFGAGAMAFILGGPLIDAVFHEDDLLRLIPSLSAFALQTLMHLKTLKQGSIFSGAMKGEDLRDRLHGGWAALIALGLVFSLLAALGTAMV